MSKAAKANVKDDVRPSPAPNAPAVIMLALGEEHSAKIWSMMDEEEIKEISQVMSNLGSVSSGLIEKLLVDFVGQMSGTGSLMGSYESTERLLARMHAGGQGRLRSWKKSAVPPAAPCGTSSPM